MKRSIVALAAHSLLTLMATCCLALAEDGPQLQKLKHAVLSPTTEQVVLQLNGSYSPKAFTLKDETPRIVFDFADMTYSREVKSLATNGSIVKRVRVGLHTDDSPKTRVVFDLSTLKGVSYTQHFDEKTSSLVVQFTGPAVPEKAPAQRKPQPEPTVEKTKTVQPAPEVEPAIKTDEPAVTETQPPPPPVLKDDQPPTPAESPKKEVAPEVTKQPAPSAEATPAAKPEPPKPADTTAATPPKSVEEKPQPPPQVQAKPEPKQAIAETKPSTGEAKPAEPVKEPAASAVTEEQKKAETTAKETKQPEGAAKPEAASTDEASKKEAAKASLPVKTAEEPQLESVKFDATSPKGEMVVFKLNGFHPPAVHGVEEGIPRVICDFNNTKLVGSTKNLIKTDGKFVKVIRTSKTKKPEKVRVVIDLEPNRSYDLQQVFFKEDNLFVLIVNAVKK